MRPASRTASRTAPRAVPRVVAVPDKLRGTATARAAAAAIGRGAAAAGWRCDEVPVADGGEGTLDVLGGPNRTTTVTGPLGEPVAARWRLGGRTAVIEMAEASGLALVGGAEGNDPVGASTAGTGELIAAAVDAGARRVLVGLGGSATTDGGLAALRSLYPLHRFAGVDIVALCDVRTPFVAAAEVFAPQKGASSAQVELLRRRLARLADVYLADHGVDVRALEGAGAAGGLAGGLAVAGASLAGGFDAVADELDLPDAVEGADLVITAEGFLDEQSFDGKVVGGVAELAVAAGVPCVAVVGEVVEGLADPPGGLRVVSLVERFGHERARGDVLSCIEEVTREVLASTVPGRVTGHRRARGHE
jgi:glycerate 2-kinase